MKQSKAEVVGRLLDAFNRGDFSAFHELDAEAELQDELTRWRASGKGKRSGIEVRMGGFCVFAFDRGKVRRLEFFEDEQEALGAAGVGPSLLPADLPAASAHPSAGRGDRDAG